KMKGRKINQIVVMDRGAFIGIAELKAIVTRDIDPLKTKIGGFAKKVSAIGPEESVENAVTHLVSAGVRALPVMEGGRLAGIISETDLIKAADQFIDTGMEIGSVKSKTVYASRDDNVGKIKHMMINENVSRVPVTDKGRVVGIVSTLNMIKALEAKSGFEAHGKTKGVVYMEKVRAEEIKAETIMSSATIIRKDEKIKNVINLLQKNEQVIVENGDVGIITPKDIIELFLSKAGKSVYVQITGMQNEGMEFQSEMDSATTKFVQKMGKSFRDIQGLFVYVESHHKQGNKAKYSIRTRFITEEGIFISHSSGWSPIEAVQDAFKKLEKETRSHMEKIRASRKTNQRKKIF
ncbi:MAG: CBS domain-containing protein, partial [Candidatus Aenigmarchaeota archaeon]|nr:CBS domain-containing protein [Candidatus Aenigmarchaeota archaeon]MDI6722149.1 CBS domain-containing protein [Candidatus Aenigmarchaeota archaeon]